MIFTSDAGELYGYVDGWQDDGCFHYTGEGQIGPQELKHGNKAILEHKTFSRNIRLFAGARGTVTYVGHFELSDTNPYYYADAPDRDGTLRKVIIFRLTPVGQSAKDALPTATEQWNPDTRAIVESVGAENSVAESFEIASQQGRTARRKEALLVTEFKKFAIKQWKYQLSRRRIRPPGEGQALYTDLFVDDQHELIEAKAGVTRTDIRMGIGQLFDYARFLIDESGRVPALALLLPERPRGDLCELLGQYHISIYFKDGTSKFQKLPF